MERENDHDYAASRHSEDGESDLDVIVALRLRRLVRPILNQISLHNTIDHDYVSITSTSSSNSSNSANRLSEEDDDRSVATIATVGSTLSSARRSSTSISEIVSIASSDNIETSSDANPGDQPNESDVEILEEVVADNNSSITSNEGAVVNSSSPPKKRKRLLDATKSNDNPREELNETQKIEDDSEGSICAICLDVWEISGEHRLASLKCGHLFGDSCIRRWLKQSISQTGSRVCPQCKRKAHPKEIRYLYAKRVRALDRSEEHRLSAELNKEQLRSEALEMDVASLTLQLNQVSEKFRNLQADYERLQRRFHGGGSSNLMDALKEKPIMENKSYKLYLERNVDISREAGCRVMVYADQQSTLIVSQKSGPGLFPGYGIRFIDTETFKATTYLHASIKLLRDISLNNDQRMLAFTSLESRAKLFDLRTNQIVATFIPSDKPLWSCTLDRNEREYSVYFGGQRGTTFVYDMRFPENIVHEYGSKNDKSPVINVATVPNNRQFPKGGFLVCTLNSVWFYEYTGEAATSHRLNIEGPFTYMEFNIVQETLLITTRNRTLCPHGRYFIGNLEKIDGCVMFKVKVTFFGSKTTPVMIRSTQIPVESNTLIGAYLLDTKMLTLFDVNNEHRIQSLPVQDVIYDMCPINSKDNTYLAALTENKCRMYRLSVND